MFGESEDSAALALVDAFEEKVVQVAPPFKLYCQRSAEAEDDAEILNPFAVIFDVLKLTVGALRSIVLRSTVADAVIVPMDTPEYVPENRHDADKATPVFVPLLL